eukprot:g922.t1
MKPQTKLVLALVGCGLLLLYFRQRLLSPSLSQLPAGALRGATLHTDTDAATDVAEGRAAKCPEVMSWGLGRGVQAAKLTCATIKINDELSIFGLKATQDIAKGEVVVAVPRHLMVFSETLAASRLAKLARDKRTAMGESTKAVLWLMDEADVPNSPFQPFLSYLWDIPMTVAYMWPQSKLDDPAQTSAYLKGIARKEKDRIKTRYDKWIPKLSLEYPELFGGDRKGRFTLERFTQAWAIFHTRNWWLPMEADEEYHGFMAPVADMLNYGFPGRTGTYVEYNKGTTSFDVIASKDLKAGDEVLFYYGEYCKDDSMNTYGFSLPEMSDKCKSRR